ncbi:MAG: nickel-type superoxide dismutase maturation protease [Actinomycetota bacterium]|jgi:nickel-type superoxide dismutase maturation protease|nr:nickel-type superoxide dismutase maturation protease [Actinomycetota bacterium]
MLRSSDISRAERRSHPARVVPEPSSTGLDVNENVVAGRPRKQLAPWLGTQRSRSVRVGLARSAPKVRAANLCCACRTGRRVATLFGAALAALGVAVVVVRRVLVSGTSMAPTLEPGDRLIAVPVFRARPGDVIVIADPRRPDRLLVKRLVSNGRGWVQVAGDNTTASTDSRDFGAINARAPWWVVVYRYSPVNRMGWIPRGRSKVFELGAEVDKAGEGL